MQTSISNSQVDRLIWAPEAGAAGSGSGGGEVFEIDTTGLAS